MKKPKPDEIDDTTDNNHNDNHNGYVDMTELKDTLQGFMQLTRDLSQRMDDIESKSQDYSGKANYNLIEYAFNTPKSKLIELSNIPPQAPRMLANEIALEHLLDPDVQSGRIPLTAIYRETWLQARKGVNGIQLMRASKIALEQATATNEDESMPIRELGAGS